MEKKRLAIVVLLSMVFVAGWVLIRIQLEKRHPEWFARPTPQVDQANNPSTSGTTQQATTMATSPTTANATAVTTPITGPRAVGGDPVPTLLGHTAFDSDGKADFPLGLNIDPKGASLASVVVNRYRQEVGKNDPYVYQKPYDVSGTIYRALATRHIDVNGVRIELENVIWKQTAASSDSVTYSVEVTDGARPVASVEKKFALKNKQDPSLGYEVAVTHSVRNLTDQPLKVKAAWYGPNMPPVENRNEIQSVVTGYSYPKNQIDISHEAATSYTPDKGPRTVKTQDAPVAWVGVSSAYFDAIVRPGLPDPTKSAWHDVTATAVAKAVPGLDSFITLTYETGELSVAPAETLALPLDVYLGPRQRETLKHVHYDAYPRDYDQTLVLSGGLCGICTWTWLINLLVGLLRVFHVVTRDWGLAIMGLVILVRLLLHPIQKKSQVQMAKMGKFAPEIERIKAKYKDDPQEQNRQMMLFYKEHGASQVLGCLPMFAQMPIWIALWASLQSTFELRHAPFLYGWTWIDDLSRPDRLVPLPFVFDVFFLPTIDAINILPLLMGVIFFVQMKFQPKPPTMTPEQEQQQKMMMWMMPFFMPLVLYNGPSGLNLYILTSTAIGIWESKRVRDYVKRQEAAEKAGPVIIDADQTPRAAQKRKEEAPKDKPQGGIAGWIANLQNQVEQMQKDAKDPKRKGNR